MLSILALGLALAPMAQAADITPTISAKLGASLYGLGLKASVRPGAKLALWNQEDSLLFGDTFLHGQVILDSTPAYSRLGAGVRFSPIAVFEGGAHYVVCPYFGTFSSVIGFDDPGADYSDDQLDLKIDQGLRGGGFGTRYGADGSLRGMVGPIIVAVTGEYTRWQLSPADNVVGVYFFEPEMALMLAWEDSIVDLGGVVLYQHVFNEDHKLIAGNYTTSTTGQATGDNVTRTGLLAVYNWRPEWSALLLVQAYLDDRVYTSPVPPFIAWQVTYSR